MNKSINNYLLFQKKKILDINKKMDFLIKTFNNKDFKSQSIRDHFIYNLDNLRNNISSIDDILDDLQYDCDINNEELDNKIKTRIKEYEDRSKIINVFAPYILYYQLINNL
jgi:hypothetical protein